MYSAEQIVELLKERKATLGEIADLIEQVLRHPFQTNRGREFGHHGLCRRLQTLHRAVLRVYELIPPKPRQLPDKHRREDAEIYLSAFITATYGAIDNLAWIWVSETGLTKPDGKPLPLSQVGLRPDNEVVLKSLPENIQAKVQSFAGWFKQNSDYRHAIAHRIPPYVLPYRLSPEDVAKDSLLDEEIWAAIKDRDEALLAKLRRRQRKMRVFVPLIQHSWGEGATPVQFHAQLIADSRTIVDLASDLLKTLNGRGQS